MEKTMEKNCSSGQVQRICISRFRDLRRTGEYMGLRQSGCGAEEQREKGLVAEIRSGEPVQCGRGLRDSDELRRPGWHPDIWADSLIR